MKGESINMTPKFSVLMANYNNGKYISEAIQSVINQSFEDWELVIVDDCSSDNSVEKIKPFLKDRRIRLLRNKKNVGFVNSLKRLINESSADIFGTFDSDDVLEENAVSIMYKEHMQNPDCGLIYSQFMYCDEALNPLRKGYCNFIPLGKTNLQCDYISHFKTFKKEFYYKTKGFNNEIRYAEDKDISFKMEEVSKVLFIDEILYYYRVLPESMSHNPAQKAFVKISFSLAKYDAFNRRLNTNIPNLSYHEMSNELFFLTSLYTKSKKYRKAICYFSKAVGLKPLNYRGIRKFIGELIKKD